MKILITGATGFIGSNVAKELINNSCEVYATHRTSSSFEKCEKFKDKVNWINTDHPGWEEKIKAIKPDQLIHLAWGGITSEQRNDWKIQIQNFWLAKEYIDLAKECNIKKIIAFGSQAEYGIYNYPVNETTAPCPIDAYGAVKTLTANYLRNAFDNSEAYWYWIRVFSVFGEEENQNWLILTVISKLLKEEKIELTGCEQVYNYLYIQDFIKLLKKAIYSDKNQSGIYNICNSESIKLKSLLNEIAQLLNVSKNLLQYGAIPYRTDQNMFISGDNSKFNKYFHVESNSLVGITQGLLNSIKYYKSEIR